jgi:quinol monooxygenase YgiN
MINRIVRMSFDPAKVEDFKALFEKQKEAIRHFEGCRHLQLWQDVSQPNIFFTYSHWESEDHLNLYRESQLFRETWAATKALFNDKPAAWSTQSLHILP